MPRNRLLPFVLAAFAAAPLAAQAGKTSTRAAGNQRLPQDCLPTSSYLAAAFGGLDGCSAAVSSHEAARLVLAVLPKLRPEITAEIDKGIERSVQEVKSHLAEAGISAGVLRAVLRRPMALGMGRITLRGMGPSLALVIDEGPAAGDVDAFVQTAMDLLQKRDDDFSIGEADSAGIHCRTLAHAKGPTVMFARMGGMYVITNSEGYLAEIAAVQNGQAAPLAAKSTLAAQRAELGTAPLLEVYAHTGPLFAMVEPLLPYEAAALGDALGVRSLGGIYAGVGSLRGGTAEVVDLAIDGAAGGMLKAAFAGKADLGAAEYCSADTIAFATLHLDPMATIAGFDAMLEQIPAPAAAEARRNIGRDFGRGLRRSGMTTEDLTGLLRALGGSVSVAVTLQKGAPLPELLLVLPVRDRAVVAQWLDKLAGMAEQQGIEWKTREGDGIAVRYCDVKADMPMPFAPAFALTDDRLILGSQPKVVLAAHKQHADRDSSLAATEDFAAMGKENASASLLLHVRQGVGIGQGWRMIETLLKAADGPAAEIGLTPEVLPEQDEIVRATGTTTLGLTIDGRGVRLRTQGNLGLGALLIGGGAMLDELLQRAASKVY